MLLDVQSNIDNAIGSTSFVQNSKTYTTVGVASLLVTDRLTTVGVSLNKAF
jgi:hypothetical protein